MEKSNNFFQTVFGSLFCVIVFFGLLYVATPIFQFILYLYGRIFIPERLGGGSQVDNPGLIQVAIRSLMMSALSAYGGFIVTSWAFSKAHAKTVAAIFSISIIAWAAFFVYAGASAGDAVTPVIVVVFGAGPALFISYLAWSGEFA